MIVIYLFDVHQFQIHVQVSQTICMYRQQLVLRYNNVNIIGRFQIFGQDKDV